MKLEKITLLRPNMGDYRASDALPPLAMGILAARTPKEIEVSFYDDRVESPPLDEPADLLRKKISILMGICRKTHFCARLWLQPLEHGNDRYFQHDLQT